MIINLKKWFLVDSGSQITATVRSPEDKIDPNIRLVAVNGSRINTYGTKEIEVKMNRKSYRIEAVICDIQQDILGMDFINKYKLLYKFFVSHHVMEI